MRTSNYCTSAALNYKRPFVEKRIVQTHVRRTSEKLVVTRHSFRRRNVFVRRHVFANFAKSLKRGNRVTAKTRIIFRHIFDIVERIVVQCDFVNSHFYNESFHQPIKLGKNHLLRLMFGRKHVVPLRFLHGRLRVLDLRFKHIDAFPLLVKVEYASFDRRVCKCARR